MLVLFVFTYNITYNSQDWLLKKTSQVTPHQDEISSKTTKCLKRYIPSNEERRAVSVKYAKIINRNRYFVDHDSLRDQGKKGANNT